MMIGTIGPADLNFSVSCVRQIMNELQMKSNPADTETESQVVDHSAPTLAVVRHEPAPSEAKVTLRTLRAETEMQAISHALEQTGWNRKRAAQLLSISYRGLLYKIRQHNITRNPNLVTVPKRAKMADTLNWEPSGLAVVGGGAPSKD
jgi:DNA-binding NtrC family response regulator